MTGFEYIAGVYLASPPAVGSPALTIVVLAILAATLAYEWLQERPSHHH